MYETILTPISPVGTAVNRSGMDWVKPYIESVIKVRGIELAKPITAMMAASGIMSFHIAGGAFYRGELNDVDIWPTTKSVIQYTKYFGQFKKDNRPYAEMDLNGIKCQFCLSPVEDCTINLINDFDFAHCKVGIYIELDQNGTIAVAAPSVTPDFIAAMALQTTWYTPGHRWPLNSLARVGKVAKKLNLSVGEAKDLSNQIVSDILNRGLQNCAQQDPSYIDFLKNYGKAA